MVELVSVMNNDNNDSANSDNDNALCRLEWISAALEAARNTGWADPGSAGRKLDGDDESEP